MNKQDLIEAVAEHTGESKALVARVLEAQADIVSDALCDGEEVTLHGLGKLKTVEKAARQGRNPQTGAPVTIEARTNVKFVTAKALKEALN